LGVGGDPAELDLQQEGVVFVVLDDQDAGAVSVMLRLSAPPQGDLSGPGMGTPPGLFRSIRMP
jgi:hypothetical protein